MKTKKRLKKKFYVFLMAFCILVLLFSGYKLIHYESHSKKENEQFTMLKERVEDRNEWNIQKELYKENNDYVGWLKVDDGEINYPVMLTEEDPEYYLRRGFNKEYSYSGTPFIGEGCNLDSKVLIIYSHNMKNGTMFASLLNYEDKDYLLKHDKVYFNTINEERIYNVVSAVKCELVNNEDSYYSYTGNVNSEMFDQLKNFINENKCYDTDTDIKYEDELLLLSTCSYHADNGRFFIVCRRIS